MIKVRKNLVGEKFGNWKVIERAEDYTLPCGQKQAQWLCECQCKKKTRKVIKQYILLSNRFPESCGCLKLRGLDSKRSKGQNEYILTEKYGIGKISGKNINHFYFDIEDYDKIKKYRWHSTKRGYILSVDIIDGKRTTIQLHTLIMGAINDKVVDHINRKPWDNRKDNLRFVTVKENVANASLSSNNTSNYTGVYWNKCGNKWTARIKENGKVKHLGSFDDKEEAIKARLTEEFKYYGIDFAPQRHLFKQYGIIEEG